jgi:hypothetical protein
MLAVCEMWDRRKGGKRLHDACQLKGFLLEGPSTDAGGVIEPAMLDAHVLSV